MKKQTKMRTIDKNYELLAENVSIDKYVENFVKSTMLLLGLKMGEKVTKKVKGG